MDEPAHTGDGWKSEDLHPEVVSTPDRFAVTAEGPVSYLRVTTDTRLLGYLWFSDDESAAAFAPAVGREGGSAKVAWVQLLQQQKADGCRPSEAVRILAARSQEHPGAGIVDPAARLSASTLRELRWELTLETEPRPVRKADAEQIRTLAGYLDVDEQIVMDTQAYLVEEDAFYACQPVRGGGSVIMASDGSALWWNSSVTFESQREAFRAGRRTPAEWFTEAYGTKRRARALRGARRHDGPVTGIEDATAGDEGTRDDGADDERVLQETALAGLRAALARAATRLEAAGARDEALAELVEPRRVMLVRRDAVLRRTGRAWRLGALMLGRDGTLYATGALIRAREPGMRNHQSQSAEERRDLRAAALRGKFAPGETVNHGWREIPLDVGSVRSGDGPLLFGPDGTIRVRWNAALGDDAARDVSAYLDERVALLVDPLDIP